MELEVGGRVIALCPVPHPARGGRVAKEDSAAIPAVDQPAGVRIGGRVARVGDADRGMDVQRDVEPVRVRPVEKAARVREERRRPLPAVPVVRPLVVGVDDEHVERHPLTAKPAQELVVVGLAVSVVAREPVAEGAARQQRRGAGQRPQVGERARIVVAVGEQVTVLVRALVRRPRRVPLAALGRQRRPGVVEEVPAVAAQQPVVKRHRPVLVVEGAVPAAEVAGRRWSRVGVWVRRGHDGRRRGGRGRASVRGERRPQLRAPRQLQPQVGGRERTGALGVAQDRSRGPNREHAVSRLRPDRGRLAGTHRHGQGRGILKAPVVGVLEPEQTRRDDLNPDRPVADHGRAARRGRGPGGGDHGKRRRDRAGQLQRRRHPPHARVRYRALPALPRPVSGCAAVDRPRPSSPRSAPRDRPRQRR